jgi:hypothetical protein
MKEKQLRSKIELYVSFVILVVIQSNVGAAGYKDGVADGYKNRCIEARASKGQEQKHVLSVCECEASVLKENFSTYELLMAGAKKKQGEEALSKEEIIEFRKKLRTCENK